LNPNFKPTPNANLVSLPAFNVADLILGDGCSWNVSLLADLFDPSTVQNILSIYLPHNRGMDKWTWTPSPSGTFSVKSAHELSAIPGNRSSPLSVAAWSSLWGIKIQARLKHLLWKIAWDILPSRANLSRFVLQDVEGAWSCPFCKGPVESLGHIFLECSLAKFLWRNSPWSSLIDGFSHKPIVELIYAIIFPVQSLGIPVEDVNNFQLFTAITLDNIWRARNILIHEGVAPVFSRIAFQISSSLEQHLTAWRALVSPSLWFPPPLGWLKGNFDVAVRGNFSVAAGVISDASGNIIMAVTHKLSSSDALAGEAFAALLTSHMAASLTSDKFCIEGDALLVVSAINNPPLFSSWCFANCITDISVVLSSFPSWNVSKVSRCANFRAHALAKWATSHLVFGSIPIGSPILSSIRIRGGKDPPL
jgi:hypothetical protein